jgi:transposase
VVISEHVTKQLELEPAQAYIVEHVRYTYACPKCRSGDQLQTTSKPPLPIDKSRFGPSVLAAIVVNKYARHLPLYRQQEQLLGPLRLWLSRSLLCRLVRGTAEALCPLARRILELILKSHVVQVDETLVRYLVTSGALPVTVNIAMWPTTFKRREVETARVPFWPVIKGTCKATATRSTNRWCAKGLRV